MLIKNINNNKLKMRHWKPIRNSNIIFSKKNPTVGWNDHLKLDYNSSYHTFKLMANVTIYNEWNIARKFCSFFSFLWSVWVVLVVFFIKSKLFQLVVEEGGNFSRLRIFERVKYFNDCMNKKDSTIDSLLGNLESPILLNNK